jgi:hypothetical protein
VSPIVRYKAGSTSIGRRTDAQGRDHVTLEGTRKTPPVTGTPVPDFRLVPVAAKVALKDTKMWQDIQDAVGTALAGNPGSMALSAITETLLRMNTLVFAGRYGLVVEDHKSLDKVILTLTASGQRTGTVRASGDGSESASGAVSFTAKPEDEDEDDAAIRFLTIQGQTYPSSLVLLENGHRGVEYRGRLDLTEECLCVEGDERTVSESDWKASIVSDEEPRALQAIMQPDGSYTLTYPIMPAWGKGTYHHLRTGCGEPEDRSDEALAPAPTFQQLVISGKVDPTKTSGVIEGGWTGSLALAVPERLGGLYDRDGVPHEEIMAQASSRFVFSYVIPAEPPRAVRACFAPGPGEGSPSRD